MSDFTSNYRGLGRKRMLASAAALALITSGVIGGSIVSSSMSANAALVTTGDLQTQGMPSLATLVERVKPAVVSVKVKMENTASMSDDDSGWKDELPPGVQDFFKHFGGRDGMAPRRSHPGQMIGQGSGFFVSADGYIVTNDHVVKDAKSVTVTMDNGKVLDAKVIGTDQKTDLALLKVTEKGDYPYVSLAKEAPRVGDWVVAIGNPFGLGGTVTAGIVSADGRDIGASPYDSYLQIDAPLNHGSSGGPTFNLKGEVVGVNTAIFSPSDGNVGIGFAIPAKTVDTVVNSLEHDGFVSRGFLGVNIQSVTDDLADGLGMKTATGALINRVESGMPAAEAGLKSGDVITKFNGQTIKDAADLTRKVGALKPGQKAEIAYLRDGKEKTANVTLGSQKGETAAKTESGDDVALLGVEVVPAKQVSGAGDEGLVVVHVDPNGAAAGKGIEEGDVIAAVSGKPVSKPEDVKAEIASAKRDGKKAVLMTIKNANGSHYVAFALPKA
jgi:serine protease Do